MMKLRYLKQFLIDIYYAMQYTISATPSTAASMSLSRSLRGLSIRVAVRMWMTQYFDR